MAKRGMDKTEKVLPAKVEAFAEDLGRLLGTAQAKANHWLGQRQEIVKHLRGVHDTASKLLADLGHQAGRVASRGRPATAGQPGPTPSAPAPQSKWKRRKMSAAARKAISEAQKKRWSAVRAKGK